MDDDDRIDKLYEAPLDRFTAERNELAASLRAAGARDQAAAVKALVKPSASAWAANQAVRRNADAVRAVVEAGELLRRAQESVLEGGDAAELRDATKAERDAVAPLVKGALDALREAGVAATQARSEELTDIFHALAVNQAAREVIAAGRLTREVRAVGFGEVGPVTFAPTKSPAKTTKKREDDDAEAGRRIEEARAEAERLAAIAADAEAEAARTREVAETAEREAERARALALEARKASSRARHESDAAAAALKRLETGK